MFQNLSYKLFALFLATIFWIFVVSIENTFFNFPEKIPLTIINQSSEVATSSQLPEVSLVLRADDPATARTLSKEDFEAYIDGRLVGVGRHSLPIFVTSKNPQVTVLRVEPPTVTLDFELVRQKAVTISAQVTGTPAEGYKVERATPKKTTIQVSGAESILKKIDRGVVTVNLEGNETKQLTKAGELKIYDAQGNELKELKVLEASIDIDVVISEALVTKDVGVRAKISGSLANGVVKKIEVTPAVLTVEGPKVQIQILQFLETEAIDIERVQSNVPKKVRVILPEGVTLPEGQKAEVTVKIEIESQ